MANGGRDPLPRPAASPLDGGGLAWRLTDGRDPLALALAALTVPLLLPSDGLGAPPPFWTPTDWRTLGGGRLALRGSGAGVQEALAVREGAWALHAWRGFGAVGGAAIGGAVDVGGVRLSGAWLAGEGAGVGVAVDLGDAVEVWVFATGARGRDAVPYAFGHARLGHHELTLGWDRGLHAGVSTAIPVLFDPVLIDGAYYYDGGLKQTIPTSLARSLGAAYVIAVDVTREIPFEPGNVQANFSRIVVSIVEEYNREELADTDVVLDPGLRDFSYMDFDLTSDFVRAGARVAERELPRILADLSALGIPLRPGGDPNRGRSLDEGWEERLRAAQRAVVTRARPWNLAFDLSLSPAARGERVAPAPAPVGSRVRLGVELRDGFLGGGAVGVRGGVTVRLDDAWTATFALGYPSGVADAAVAYRAPGVWLDGNAAWGTAGWWRGYGEARGATALGGRGICAGARSRARAAPRPRRRSASRSGRRSVCAARPPMRSRPHGRRS